MLFALNFTGIGVSDYRIGMENKHKILVLDDDADWLETCRDFLAQLPSAPEIRIALRANFETACERRAPVIVETRVAIAARGTLYSDLILPLSADGHNVDAILLGSYPLVVQKL